MSSRYWSITDCCWTSSSPAADLEAERWAPQPSPAEQLPPPADLADAVPQQRADAQSVTA